MPGGTGLSGTHKATWPCSSWKPVTRDWDLTGPIVCLDAVVGYHDSYYAVNGESAKPEKTPGRVARKAGSYTVGGGWVARKAGSYMVGGFAKVTNNNKRGKQ